MKKLLLAAMLGSVMFQPSVAPAATQGADFDVSVTLNSACQMTSVNDVVFTYTSLGAAQVSTGGDFNITCTNGLNYSFTLHVASGQTAVGAASINSSVLGLNYTLNAPANGSGSGVAQARSIAGSMGAGQAGNCALASCNGTNTHSLVVEF